MGDEMIRLEITPNYGGSWTVKIWRGFHMAMTYTREPSLQEAVDRGVAWLREATGRKD